MDELENLYNILSRDGYYTKSFNDFKSQYKDEKYRDKVYEIVSRDGLYTKSKEDFLNKYSGDVSTQSIVAEDPILSNVKEDTKEGGAFQFKWGGDGLTTTPTEVEVVDEVEVEEPSTAFEDIVQGKRKKAAIEYTPKFQAENKPYNNKIEVLEEFVDVIKGVDKVYYPNLTDDKLLEVFMSYIPENKSGRKVEDGSTWMTEVYRSSTIKGGYRIQPTQEFKDIFGENTTMEDVQRVRKEIIFFQDKFHDQDLKDNKKLLEEAKKYDPTHPSSVTEDVELEEVPVTDYLTNLAKDYDEADGFMSDMISDVAEFLTEEREGMDMSIAKRFDISKHNIDEFEETSKKIIDAFIEPEGISFSGIKEEEEVVRQEQIDEVFTNLLDKNTVDNPLNKVLLKAETPEGAAEIMKQTGLTQEELNNFQLSYTAIQVGKEKAIQKKEFVDHHVKELDKLTLTNLDAVVNFKQFEDLKETYVNKLRNLNMNDPEWREKFFDEDVKNAIFKTAHAKGQTEEKFTDDWEGFLNAWGINIYATAGESDDYHWLYDERRDNMARLSNAVTISSRNGPPLVLYTNQTGKYADKFARTTMDKLFNYVKEYGSFVPPKTSEELVNSNLSAYSKNMIDKGWMNKQVDQSRLALQGIRDKEENNTKIRQNFENKLTEKINTFSEEVKNKAITEGWSSQKYEQEVNNFNQQVQQEYKQFSDWYSTQADMSNIKAANELLINSNSIKVIDGVNDMLSELGTWESIVADKFVAGVDKIVDGVVEVAIPLGIVTNPYNWAISYTGGTSVDERIKQTRAAYNQSIRSPFSRVISTGASDTEYGRALMDDWLYGDLLSLVENAPAVLASMATGGSGFLVSSTPFALYQTAYMMEEMDNALDQDGNKYLANMPEWKKWAVILPTVAAVSVLERFGVDKITSKEGWIVNSIVMNTIKKSSMKHASKAEFNGLIAQEVDNMIARGVIRVVDGALVEGVTEGTQQIVEMGFKETFEFFEEMGMKSKPILDEGGKIVGYQEPNIWSTAMDQGSGEVLIDVLRAMRAGMIGGAGYGTIGAIANGNQTYSFGKDSDLLAFEYTKAMLRNKNSLKSLEDMLEAKALNGKLTPKQLEEHKRALAIAGGVFKQIESGADGVDQKISYDLILEKQDLKNTIEQKGKDNAAWEVQRVKEIEAELAEISIYAKENSTNVGALRNISKILTGRTKSNLSKEQIETIEGILEGRDILDGKIATDVIEKLSNELFNIEKQLVKENNTSAAREIAQLNSALNNAATSSDVMVNQDLDAQIIQDLQTQMGASSNNLDQSYFVVNNKLVSQREFENLLQDQDFINDVKSGEASYSVIGASQNIKNKIQESEVLSPEKVTEERVEMMEEVVPTGKIQALNTTEEFLEAAEAQDIKFSQKDKEKGSTPTALITPQGDILIDKTRAAKINDVSAVGHEVLHRLIDAKITDPETKNKIISDFKDVLEKRNKQAYQNIEKRIYGEYGDVMSEEELENSDEWVTAFFDEVASGSLKFNNNLFTKIGDFFANIFKGAGFNNLNFKSGRQVYNFAKDYGAQYKKGKLDKKTKQAITEAFDKDIVSEEKFSKAASDKVQSIYEEQGPAGAFEIIEQFKPIVNRIVQRRSEAPGFDRQLLTDEIETGERGILDLINAYKPESGVPLAAYINKYLPARSIEASKRVLGEVFEADVTEARGIVEPAAEEVITERAETVKEKPKAKTTRQKLGIKTGSELYNKVKEAVAKTFGTKLPDPDSPNFRKELNKAYRTELKKPIADLLGTRTAYKQFLETNWENLYNAIPQSILNKRFKQFIEPVVDKSGKQRREKTAVGKGVFQKRDITKQEFLNYFLSPDVGASTRGTRKDALAEAIGEELALDATMEVIQDPKVLERYEQVRELEGKPTTKQTIPKISEKVERPRGFKFSIQKNIREGVRKEGAEPITVGKQSVDRLVEIFLNDALDTFGNFLFQDVTKKGKFQFISSSVLSNAGNTLERARKAGFPFIGSYKKGLADTQKRLMKDNPNMSEKKAEAQALKIMKPTRDALNAGELFETENLKNLVKEALKDRTKKFTTEELRLLNLAIDGQTRVKLGKNIKNIEDINKGKDLLLDLLRKLYQKNPKNLDFISFISYHHKSNTNPFRNFGTVIGEEIGNLKRPYEEHTLPFGEFATMMLKAITKSNEIFKGFKNWIKDNYFQEVIEYGTTRAILDQPIRSLAKDNRTKLPSWKSKSQLHPLLNQHIQEALEGKREWKDVVSPDIRKYNEYSSALGYVNPNKVSRLGITDAQRYNVEVAKDLQNNPDMIAAQNKLIYQQLVGEITNTKDLAEALKAEVALVKGKYKASRSNIKSLNGSGVVKMSKSLPNSEILREAGIMDKALNIARDPNAPTKKIRVFDFDDTLAQTKSNVLYTMPDGKKGKLTAEKFAKDGTQMLEQGAEFDFSEFNKVMEGKKGPLFEVARTIQNVRGTEDVFVLTARAQEAAPAIKEFLDSVGLDIPLENITGLGDSSPLAKSGWIVDKAGEGYNDFYFADDHGANVEAVQRAINALPVKGKTQQAKVKFSMNTKRDLNWKKDGNDFKTNFKLKGKTYNIRLQEEFYPAKGVYELDFGLEGDIKGTLGKIGITKTGNAAEVFSIVSNGVLDFVRTNKVNEIQFSAIEPSRSRLYSTLTKFWANKLGWGHEADINLDGSGKFTIGKDVQNVSSFDNQSTPERKVLRVVDKKSKVQRAQARFSKNVDKDFNQILEAKTGVDWYKEYSAARAQTMGAGKGKFKFLIPPSAEDFTGLLYRFLGKGKVGDAQMAWFKEHLLNPYARGMNDLSTDRVVMMNDFNALKKELVKSGAIPKNLRKKAIDNFTYSDIARVMAWDQQGIEVADLSKRDMAEFRKFMEKNPGLQVFVDQLIAINKGDGYAYPGKNWLAGSITTDLVEGLNTNKRDKYLEQWRENVDLVFSEKNLNKIEALFGTKYREALEDSLRRMKSGKNRTSTGNRLENRLLDYINNSVGTVMFLNMRSGVLQTISAINFLNWKDNNPLRAGMAFANQKQYWSDFLTLMNSDFLIDRRKGLKINVSESEIADAARNEKNKARAVVNYLLKKGFTVTQIMDSFAIASGGATFYRNRIKSLMKSGMSKVDAEAQAFQDFRETAEESQQSSRPDKISQQQASGLGRVVLAFANTPMQYNRIIKKATLDLINGRGDYKTNLSKIVYYGMVQNLLFTALQQAIFAMGFGDDEEEEVKKEKYYKVGNSMLDNLLRGIGLGGQAVLTVKNIGMDVYDKYQKSVAPDASYYDKQPDYAESAWHLLDFSPPISIKARKLRQAANTWKYNNWKHDKDPWSLDDPAWLAGGYVISSLTNIPLDRLVKKMDNVRGAMEADQEWWKRVAMLSGWAEWELESTADRETRKQEEKTEKRVFEGKQDPTKWTETEQKDILRQYKVSETMIKRLKTKEQKAQAIEKLRKKTNKTYTPDPILLSSEYAELAKTNKDEQVKILKDFKVSSSMISRLSTEDKRIKAIIKLRKKYLVK